MSEKLAVLVSGSGTLLDAIVTSGIEVSLVVADRDCLAVMKAEQYGIEVVLLRREIFVSRGRFDRDTYTGVVKIALERRGITVVSMAGWMTIFTQGIFDVFEGRIINNHPSLLPEFKGDNAVQDALDAGVSVTGCTIHIATVELDNGPILVQEEVPVIAGDTVESLHNRIKRVEQSLLPKVLREHYSL